MSSKPLTFFTALSLAAHAALFGTWAGPGEQETLYRENTIEVGLVVLPRIEQDFSRDRSRAQPLPEQKPARAGSPPEALSRAPVGTKRTEATARTGEQLRPDAAREALRDEARTEPSNAAARPAAVGIAPGAATEAAPLAAANPAPSYPDEALRYGWEGEVWLRVDVNRHGSVDKVSIARSSGYPVLDRAAARTVRTWRFEPARVGHQPVEGSVRVPIRFRINRS